MKVIFLIRYLDKKIIFRKVKTENVLFLTVINQNAFRRLIQMQKSIEFQLQHWEIPQLSPYHWGSFF